MKKTREQQLQADVQLLLGYEQLAREAGITPSSRELVDASNRAKAEVRRAFGQYLVYRLKHEKVVQPSLGYEDAVAWVESLCND